MDGGRYPVKRIVGDVVQVGADIFREGHDILAAHRAGIAVAAVRSGGFEEKLLANAEFLFDNVGELVRRFDEVDEYFLD